MLCSAPLFVLLARRAASSTARGLTRTLSTRVGSPSEPPPAAASSEKQLSRDEERRERAKMISDMMREKTMREVSAAASSRRPEGVSHMLRDSSDDAAEAEEPQYAAKYDDDSDEWGGPKGLRTPRSLDAARAATHAREIMLCRRTLTTCDHCMCVCR